MSSSYDGSLLDHLAAHMPLHCIIIVAPPSCPFVVPACCCLLHCLCRWPRIPLLADCCVHPPLLPPSTAVTKKSLCHHMPSCKRIMSSTPLLLSALLSLCCVGCLLPNTLLLLLASLPLLCPCQSHRCTGIIAVVALASLPLLPPTLPLSIPAVKLIFAMHHSFG
jgi:hypothetical protein